MVPRELVDDQERRELDQLVERRAERVDVVQDAPGDNGVERLRVELLERDAAVERACGCVRIDREDVVARGGKFRGDAALPSAADLENSSWRIR